MAREEVATTFVNSQANIFFTESKHFQQSKLKAGFLFKNVWKRKTLKKKSHSNLRYNMSVLFNDALQGKFLSLLLMLIEKQDIEKLCSVFENKATLKWTCVVLPRELASEKNC